MFLYKNLFFNIFYSFNPNHAYWNQRRLFSGNLPGMFPMGLKQANQMKNFDYTFSSRRQPLNYASAIIYVLYFFLQFNDFELFWGAVFF